MQLALDFLCASLVFFDYPMDYRFAFQLIITDLATAKILRYNRDQTMT